MYTIRCEIAILLLFIVFNRLLENMATKKGDSCIKNDSNVPKSVKILIVGDFGTGKTTLIKTYLDVDHMPEDEVDVFEQYRVRIKYKGNDVDVGLFDLRHGPAAPERRESYPTDVNTILICFSIGRYNSLKGAYNLWIHEVRAHYGKLLPIFLVGLGSDLRPRSHSHSDDDIVEKSAAESIHKKYSFHGDYLECSMYDRSSIVNVINKAFFAAMGD